MQACTLGNLFSFSNAHLFGDEQRNFEATQSPRRVDGKLQWTIWKSDVRRNDFYIEGGGQEFCSLLAPVGIQSHKLDSPFANKWEHLSNCYILLRQVSAEQPHLLVSILVSVFSSWISLRFLTRKNLLPRACSYSEYWTNKWTCERRSIWISAILYIALMCSENFGFCYITRFNLSTHIVTEHWRWSHSWAEMFVQIVIILINMWAIDTVLGLYWLHISNSLFV